MVLQACADGGAGGQLCGCGLCACSWAASVAVTRPIAAGEEPNLVLYCALMIVATLGLFTAVGGGELGAVGGAAAGDAARYWGGGESAGGVSAGAAGAKLVEINLVMGIVRIALIVLAMVFSAYSAAV